MLVKQHGNRFGLEKSRSGYLRCVNQCCRPTLRMARHPPRILGQLKSIYALRVHVYTKIKDKEIIESNYWRQCYLINYVLGVLSCLIGKISLEGMDGINRKGSLMCLCVQQSIMPRFCICICENLTGFGSMLLHVMPNSCFSTNTLPGT